MKKIFVCIFILLFAKNIWSQNKVEIKLDNPYPRVGQEVSISFSGEFLSQEKEASFDEQIKLSNIVFKETKEYKVGPFGFVFDDKQYSTNYIKVFVEPQLPFKEGIWARAYEEGESFVLIVEQQIKLNRTVNMHSDGIETSFNSSKEFAKINPNAVEGVSFYMKMSHSKGISENKEDFHSEHYHYSIQVYSVEISPSLTKGFKLTDKNFINFPNGIDFTPIIIQHTKKL